MRLDKYKVNDFSRSKMQQLIKENKVLVNGKVVSKASYEVNENDVVTLLLDEYNFPSRAGYKLLKAIKEFNLDFKDKIILDVGASTGGFTSCSLYFGAKQVYSVDVGDSQLVESLKQDKRVKSIENMNILDLKSSDVDDNKFDYIVIDVSFVSLESIMPCLKKFLKDDGLIVALIKPQFETLKYQTKNHIIKDPTIHKIILRDVITNLDNIGYSLLKLDYSPIKGSKGNIEFIALLTPIKTNVEIDIKGIVDNAHRELKKED